VVAVLIVSYDTIMAVEQPLQSKELAHSLPLAMANVLEYLEGI